MSGKLKVTGETPTPNDPMIVKAYCEGRDFKKAGGTLTFAAATTGTEVANNAIVYSAKIAGNGIAVNLINPLGNSKPLSVSVSGVTINVSLATDSGGAITSTATLVIAAIDANTAASVLVHVANSGVSTGAGVCAVASAVLTGSNYTAGLPNSANTNAFVAGMLSYGGGAVGARDCCATLPTA